MSEANVRYSASKLMTSLPQPGQLLLFSSPEQQPSKRPLYFGNCRKIDSHKSSNAAIGAFAANDSIRLDWSAAISSQVGWLGRPLGSLG